MYVEGHKFFGIHLMIKNAKMNDLSTAFIIIYFNFLLKDLNWKMTDDQSKP